MEEMAQDQYVEFIVQDVRYAISIHHIHEIIRVQEITPIPNHKSFVQGVINLRGKVLPVVDLRERMGLGRAPSTKLSRILVIHTEREPFGLIVDQVNRVMTLVEILPAPDFAVRTGGHDLLAGIAKEQDALINILQVEDVFSY